MVFSLLVWVEEKRAAEGESGGHGLEDADDGAGEDHVEDQQAQEQLPGLAGQDTVSSLLTLPLLLINIVQYSATGSCRGPAGSGTAPWSCWAGYSQLPPPPPPDQYSAI
jgi:hypothetical protein